MKKFIIIFKLTIKFLQRYLAEYLVLLIKPVSIALIGFLFLLTVKINPILALFALFITIPCIFYSFWKGFFITYALNCASNHFIQENAKYDLKKCLEIIKKDEKKFAVYISKSFLIIIVPFLFLLTVNLCASAFSMAHILMLVVFIIFFCVILLLIPFYFFMTQAYYYKKENDNFYSIFKNCYKNLDSAAFLIFLFSIITNILTGLIKNMYISLTFSLIFSLFIYCLCAFWFYGKTLNKDLNNIITN